MSGLATTVNGRIPPKVRRMEVIEVAHVIGEGSGSEPFRCALSYYNHEGRHLFTLADQELLAIDGHDAKGGKQR